MQLVKTNNTDILPLGHRKAIDLLPTLESKQHVTDKYEGTKLMYPQSVGIVMGFIQDAINNLGHYEQAAKNSVIQLIAENVITLVLKDFPNLTEQELHKALDNGSKGNYGVQKSVLHTVNVENVNFWIKSFLDDEHRATSLNYYHLLLNQAHPKTEPTDEQKEIIIREGCIKAWERYKAVGEMPDLVLCGVYYDKIKETHGIKWTKEEGAEIKTQAAEIYKQKLIHQKAAKDISKEVFEAKMKDRKEGELLECKKICLRILFSKSDIPPYSTPNA